MKKKNAICIMADFGWGPYAWFRKADELPPYVGINIANSKVGFVEEFECLKKLEKEFAAWATDYGRNCNKKEFNWENFNAIGLSLAKKVKAIVGKKYNVEYHKSTEDPKVNRNSHCCPVNNRIDSIG